MRISGVMFTRLVCELVHILIRNNTKTNGRVYRVASNKTTFSLCC